MRVLLTFDVEVWCDGWNDLDAKFPSAFERYVFGASSAGSFALPKILDVLAHRDLRAVFFVEPLFSARFGIDYLRTIVELIRAAGQEVQLHLHPEWTDEISPPPVPVTNGKRQHLRYYDCDEQTALVKFGIELLCAAGAERPIAFRAGSFAANADTYVALARNQIAFDSSIDASMPDSVPDLRGTCELYGPSMIAGVTSIPMTVFMDGTQQLRHAQIGACAAVELSDALASTRHACAPFFVTLAHNFELLKPASSSPDNIVLRRFENFCAHLAECRDRYPTAHFSDLADVRGHTIERLPSVPFASTMRRYAEQALRRLL